MLFLFLPGWSQKQLPADTGKYRINLPGYWKAGNKVWEILTEKLPLVCGEIKDKDLCGDHCRPGYTFEFQLSGPSVIDYRAVTVYATPAEKTYDIITSYSFTSSLLLFDSRGKLLSRFILVDTDETWTVSRRVSLATQTPGPAMALPMYSNPVLQATAYQLLQQRENFSLPGLNPAPVQTPQSYIRENMHRLAPQEKDLLAIVDRKFRRL